jgi:hypothetical protein
VDSERAREVLACYRPGRDDPRDPRFAEALDQARHDAALGRWLEQQTALDAALREQLQQVPVPPDLRTRILQQYPMRPVATAWWRQPRLGAAAVVLLVLAASVSSWLARRPDTFDVYRIQMAATVSGEYEMNLKSKDWKQIRGYLASSGWPSDYALTPAMQGLEAEGGSTITWHGKKISLICVDAGKDEDLFLFVIQRSALRDAPATETPQFARVSGMITAAWTADDKLYLLAGHGDEQFLRRYL